MSAFKNFVCWSADETQHFVRREALEGEPAAFLAVHFPIRGFQIVLGELPEPSDHALLNALESARPHAIAMVEGEPGSGKSHLIQWLGHRWTKNDGEKVVLVPRSDGSLTGALDRLRTELGHPYSEPLHGIGSVSQLTHAGITNQFIGNLVTAAQGKTYADDRRPRLADWLDDREAWKVLNHSALRQAPWSAPDEIVAVIRGKQGQRDQAAAEFTPTHILDLVTIIRNAQDRSIGSFRAERFFADLQREAPKVRDAANASPDVHRQAEVLATTAPVTATFLSALNARIADALQGTLGMQRGELERKFLEVRRLLRKDGKRLVLLLEDVTNLQGVDQQLIEALLPNPNIEANRSLCDLVAVLGVTPQYQSQVLEALGNVQDRLRFHIRLTPVEGKGVVGAQALFLATPERRKQFVASYLNAARLGLQTVREWANDEPGGPRPNSCHPERCEFREPCFATFGWAIVPNVGTAQGEAVGLYPLTAAAVERFWDRLEHPEHLRSLKTPRGLLLNVISGILGDAPSLAAGKFPSPKVDSRNLRIEGSPELDERIVQLPPDERARLRRAVQSWGDPQDGRSRPRAGGERTYSGIPQGVAFAFGLRWPGEEIAEPDIATPPVDEPSPDPAESANLTQPEPEPNPEPRPETAALPDAWAENVKDLNRWSDGTEIRNAAPWEALLYDAVSALDPGALGVQKGIWDAILTENNVALAGARGRTTQFTLELQPSPFTVRGLTALAWLRHGTGLTGTQRMLRFAQASAFQSYLAEEAVRHVRASEDRLSHELGGHPAELAVRSLVLTAFFEEKARPDEAPLRTWKAALVAPEQQPMGRCKEWQELQKAVTPERSALLKNATGLLRIGASKGVGLEGLVDGSRIWDIVRLVQQAPDSWGPRRKDAPKRDAWATALQVGDLLRERFASAVAAEHRDVAQRVAKLDAATDGRDTEQFLTDAKAAIDATTKASQDLVPQPMLQTWRSARTALATGQLDCGSPKLRAVDKAVAKFDSATDGVREQLAAVLAIPKGDLVAVDTGVTAAAQVVLRAFETLTTWKRDGDRGRNKANELEEAAEILEEASKALRTAFAGGAK